MVKVTVGKAEDPWCEIELTEEDVEDKGDAWKVCLKHIGDHKDWKKGVDITEEKLKEAHLFIMIAGTDTDAVLLLPPLPPTLPVQH